MGKRKDRQITNYYEKIRQGKQEKLFHEVIFQIGNREDMAVGTTEGDLAVKVLDEYVKNFQQRNPTLHVFCCYLHQDEATPHGGSCTATPAGTVSVSSRKSGASKQSERHRLGKGNRSTASAEIWI